METFPNARKVVEQLTVKLAECNDGFLDDEKKMEAKQLLKEVEEA